MTDTQTEATSWLEVESASIQAPIGERLPTMKFEENKIVEFDVDFTKPFNKWTDKDEKGKTKAIKAIVPVVSGGVRMNWWLNVKNPIYKDLLTRGKKGQNHFKAIRTGSLDKTRYNFVD